MNLPDKLPMPDAMEKDEILTLLLSEKYGFLPEKPVSMAAEIESCDESFCAGGNKPDL